jgi:hypothetical protein
MNILKHFWNDPVTSKLIANLIQAIVMALAWRVMSHLNRKKAKEAVISFWTAKIEFWKYFLLLLFVLALVYVSLRR